MILKLEEKKTMLREIMVNIYQPVKIITRDFCIIYVQFSLMFLVFHHIWQKENRVFLEVLSEIGSAFYSHVQHTWQYSIFWLLWYIAKY